MISWMISARGGGRDSVSTIRWRKKVVEKRALSADI